VNKALGPTSSYTFSNSLQFYRDSINTTWTAWSLVFVLPSPSTVVTAIPCMEHSGARQALSDMCLERPVKVFSKCQWH